VLQLNFIADLSIGPCKPTKDDFKRTPLLVRRKKVAAALEWLKLNHCDYFDLDKESLSVITLKPGKSDYSTPKSFWPLVLLNTLGKLFEKLLAHRLQFDGVAYGTFHPMQFGGVAPAFH
jgi:hypothetical protein